MKQKFIPDTRRNYGIDALRLASMYMVVMLHVIGLGKIMDNARGMGKYAASLIWIICFCSVNCFAIISGYVSYSEREKPYRFSKYASLWLQVACYSFGISLLAFLLMPGAVSVRALIRHAMPVSTNHYWYFTAYSMLFFLIPWLNKLVRSCSRQEMNRLVLVLFVLFSVFASFCAIHDVELGLGSGYSFLWLAVLYLIGAWMKKCDIPERIKPLHAVLCAIACVLIAWYIRGIRGNRELITYISPPIVLMAASLVVLFARMKICMPLQKLIAFSAPAAFGVYLIHLQEGVLNHLLKGRFAWMADSPVWLLVLQLILCTSVIFIVCLLVEKLRILVFTKLGINRRAEALCSCIGRKLLRMP